MRSAAPKDQPVPRSAAVAVQRSTAAVARPAAEPSNGPRTRADTLAGIDIDDIVGLVSRRLRAEFRLDRERFGRLRDSSRW
jgi:hypothetical protein